MSENLKLGQIITTPQERDAIHIAVVPVVSGGGVLPPGKPVFMQDGKAFAAPADVSVGVVDPFLKTDVQPGQTFWLYLTPGSITSLRHDWTHPAFPAGGPSKYSPSEQWIRDYAASVPLDYGIIMSGAADWLHSRERGGYGEYLCFGGLLEGESVPDEFWPHYEAVTGKTVPDEHRGSFFTCSC